MYSSEDFERLFIRYKGEAYPKGERIQTFCYRNNVPYNLFGKCYKDTRHKVVEVNVSGRPSPLKEGKPEGTVPQEVKASSSKVHISFKVGCPKLSAYINPYLFSYLLVSYEGS